MRVRHIAVFASGSGTNAENIIRYFAEDHRIRVNCLLSNRPDAYALVRAAGLGVETFVFGREELYDSGVVSGYLEERRTDLVVLAGFLWLIPSALILRFPVINIHPALLPKYGGRNMYGERVHAAVIANGEKESGITIHSVNERYDEGTILFQARCLVEPGDTPGMLAEKVHRLEYEHYPRIIRQVALSL